MSPSRVCARMCSLTTLDGFRAQYLCMRYIAECLWGGIAWFMTSGIAACLLSAPAIGRPYPDPPAAPGRIPPGPPAPSGAAPAPPRAPPDPRAPMRSARPVGI